MYITFGLPRRDQDLPDPIKNPYGLWVRDALEAAYDQVRRNSGQDVRRQKRLYDRRAVPRLFAVGDWIMRYYLPAKKCKLDSAWMGLYLVVSLVGWTVGIQLHPDSPILLIDRFQPLPPYVWGGMYITFGLPRRDQDLPDPIKNPYGLWVRDTLEVAYDQVRRNSGQDVRRQKRLYDRRAVPRLFAVGDWIMRYYLPDKKCKLDSAWMGLYLVVSLVGWTVGIQLHPDSPILLIHCQDLKKIPYPSGLVPWIDVAIAEGSPAPPLLGSSTVLTKGSWTDSAGYWSSLGTPGCGHLSDCVCAGVGGTIGAAGS